MSRMKGMGFTAVFMFICMVSSIYASEVSLLGTSPITKESESGIALNMVNASTGSFTFDSDNIQLEVFYRRCDVESFDWGFTLAPMPLSALPGAPDFLFDLKARIFKGANIIPSFSLGVNMIRITNLDFSNFNPSFRFLDEGRVGLSWEFINYGGEKGQQRIKRNLIYAGVNLTPGGTQLGNRYFAGAKFGNLNLTMVIVNEIHSIGLSYGF